MINARRPRRRMAKVEAGPVRDIPFATNDPCRRIIKTKRAFDCAGQFDRIGGIMGWRVRDRREDGLFAALGLVSGEDHAWPVFLSFGQTNCGFGGPKK